MDKSHLYWLLAILTVFGAAVTAGHPAWGTVTGIAILLLTGAIAGGAIAWTAVPTRMEDSTVKGRVVGQKISNSLVTLSSAAILAIYAAGYHRTGSAADRFAAQAAHRKAAVPVAATGAAKAATLGVEAPPTVPPSPAPPLGIVHRRPSSTHVPNAAPAPALPPEDSVATPSALSGATTTADPANPAAPPPAATRQLQYKDGTYLGWGSCRHGDIQASVVITGGQIVSTSIAQCLTRYSCSWIADLPSQVVRRQNPSVDYVSGATQSSNAFSDAVAAALSQASE